MHTMLMKQKLFEQSKVYQAIKNGDTTLVQYSGYEDEEWGTSDANYVNRMRIAYYLLYAKIDDENMIAYLFQEELKDRESNSFQGIGYTLQVLTSILRRYNNNGKYNVMFEEAKNANFDCFCGYDENYWIDDEIFSLDLMDCIFLARDLDYKDVMEVLVNKWKDGIEDWTDANRGTLIDFNSFLGKEQENEAIYKILLENAIMYGKIFDIVLAYNKLIRYYINICQFETANFYLQKIIDIKDFKEVESRNLFSNVLEECLEIIGGGVKEADELWKWAKPYLEERVKKKTSMYGNLYTKGIIAAQAVGDTYAIQLKQEYIEWAKKVGLKERINF